MVATMRGHKRRRPNQGNNAWELIVDLGRDPVSGRRKQRSRMFRGTAKQADTQLAKMVTEATSERTGPGTDAPLNDLVARWLELGADYLSPTTVAGYRKILRCYIAPGIGTRPIGKITTAELDGFYRALLATGLAPATVRQTHAVLRRSFRQGVRWGWVPLNPAAEASPPPVRRAKVKPPAPAQVAALLAHAEASGFGMAALYRTAASTGLRRGEICGLRWSRVDLDDAVMMIDSTVVELAGLGFIEKGTKTGRDREVALAAGNVQVLRELREACDKLAADAGVERDPDPFVWSLDVAGAVPLRPDVVSKRFARLRDQHAPGVRLHDLRHFSVSRLLAAGVATKTVSERHGHSETVAQDVYGHRVDEADREAAAILEDLIDGG